MNKKQELTLLSNVTPKAITSSTDATPIVVTCTAHGFTTGDRVMIYGHTTNIGANGIYKVTVLTADTFSLGDEITGADIAGSGAGAGAGGIALLAPQVLLASDFINIELQVSTGGTTTTTIKIAGSQGRPEASATSPRLDYPNIGATVSPANPYSFLQMVNLADGSAVNGADGIVVAGTDITNNYEININSVKYITVVPVSWSQGAITIKALLTSSI